MSNSKSSIMIVAGTRPEAIKLAPVIEWIQKLNLDFIFVWSGQHYHYEMSKIFFEQLGLPEPDENLNVRSGTHAEQTAKVMIGLEKVIEKYKPSMVIAEGDTNTVVATALTATKVKVPFAHVEAGLRSWDKTMPEEINRILADAIAELHFAPTELAAINLMHEGIPLRKIHITGNTIVDVVLKHRNKAIKEGKKLLQELRLTPYNYLLITAHRPENVDNPQRLTNIVKALIELSKYYPIIFPIHPRTIKRLKQCNNLYNRLKEQQNIILLKPIGYFQFLGLLNYCRVVLTDSGGVQEEALTLAIPTITLRYNTERPETVLLGINTLVGTEYQKIINQTLIKAEKYSEIRRRKNDTPNPLGDGKAGERIAKIIKDLSERIKIEEFDSREDPYITYAVIDNISDINEQYLVAYYDETSATLSEKRIKKLLIRAPLSYIHKILNIREK